MMMMMMIIIIIINFFDLGQYDLFCVTQPLSGDSVLSIFFLGGFS